ncbi:MAG TPA: hypothetical protein VFE46_04415 [Pirellulales bacterium]|jgi:twitching motility protein PilT|nr:hypothetical protein [Pirellulales bacterium]
MSWTFDKILKGARQLGASDVHLVKGVAPAIRINGEIRPIAGSPLSKSELLSLYNNLLNEEQQRQFEKDLQLCFSRQLEDIGRFRISVYMHAGCHEFAIRLCETTIRTADELGLPQVLTELTRLPNGLVLVTGPIGMGKDYDVELHDQRD